LFWIVELPEDAIHVSNNGRRASVRAEGVPVLDSFHFGGPTTIPATVTYSIEWEATGPASRPDPGRTFDDQAPERAEQQAASWLNWLAEGRAASRDNSPHQA
jgi:hypothetical protein